jgi:glycosyltransferase involved in cell wall biosynthesis
LGLEKRIVRRACSAFDRIIVHHDSAIDDVVSHFSIPHMRERFDVIPHGNYFDCYPGKVSKQEARRLLCIPEEDFVFLLFGQLRANKGIENLLSAFVTVCGESEAPLRLVLAGRAEPQIKKLIINAQSHAQRIDFREGFVAEDLVQPWHAAADAAVFPFSTGLTSGSLILAMGFGLPVIAAAVGDARHLVSRQGGQLIASGHVDELGRALKEMSLARQEWVPMGRRNRQLVSEFRWDLIGAKTMDCYKKAIQR